MATEQETQPRKSLATLIEEVVQRIKLEDVRVCLPATVVAYSAGPVSSDYGNLPAMVEVEVDLQQVRIGYPDDADESETATEIVGELSQSAELKGDYPTFSCPVFYPGPATMWSRGAITVGEQGLVIWTDRDLGRWLVAARSGSVGAVDPKWSLSHGDNASAAFFLPGLVNGPNFPDSVPAEGGKIGPRDDTSSILMDSAGVTLAAEEDIAILAAKALSLDAAAGDAVIDASGVVKLGLTAVQALALLPEIKVPIAALAAAYAAAPGLVWATDAVPIKAAWVAFASAFAALTGSAKGRG